MSEFWATPECSHPLTGEDDEETVGCCWSAWRALAQGQAFWGSHLVTLNLSKCPLAKLLWADLALEKTSEYFWGGRSVRQFCLEGNHISLLILPALSYCRCLQVLWRVNPGRVMSFFSSFQLGNSLYTLEAPVTIHWSYCSAFWRSLSGCTDSPILCSACFNTSDVVTSSCAAGTGAAQELYHWGNTKIVFINSRNPN